MNSRERRKLEAEKFNAKREADIAEKEARAKREQDIQGGAPMMPWEGQSRSNRNTKMLLVMAAAMAAQVNDGNNK